MDIGSILLIASLGVLIVILLIRPFMDQEEETDAGPGYKASSDTEHRWSALLAEKERVILTLQELDFDHRMGKVPQEEYQLQRREYLQKGAEALRELDDLGILHGSGKDPRSKADASEGSAETSIEGPGRSREDEELEELIAVYRHNIKSPSSGFCPGCGKPVRKTDQFCPRCGKEV